MALTFRYLLVSSLLLLGIGCWAAKKRNNTVSRSITSIFNPLNIGASSRGEFRIVKQECINNPSILTLKCEHTVRANTSGSLVLWAEYLRSISAVVGEIKLMFKLPSEKVYKTSNFRQKMDYCMMSINQDSPNFLLVFMPAGFEKILPVCPLFGKYEFNFTLPIVPMDLNIFPPKDYRLDIVFTTDNQVLVWRSVSYLKIVKA